MTTTSDRMSGNATVGQLASWTADPAWTRTYVNDAQVAQAEVARIVEMLTSGAAYPYAGIDTETSPI